MARYRDVSDSDDSAGTPADEESTEVEPSAAGAHSELDDPQDSESDEAADDSSADDDLSADSADLAGADLDSADLDSADLDSADLDSASADDDSADGSDADDAGAEPEGDGAADAEAAAAEVEPVKPTLSAREKRRQAIAEARAAEAEAEEADVDTDEDDQEADEDDQEVDDADSIADDAEDGSSRSKSKDRSKELVGVGAAAGAKGSATKIAKSDGKQRATRKQAQTVATAHKPRRTGPIRFVLESVAELRKVVYPTGQQLMVYFGVVLTFVLFLMAYVSGLDFGFGLLVLRLLGQ